MVVYEEKLYPVTNSDEVSNWLQIEAFQSAAIKHIDKSHIMGRPVDDQYQTIRLQAPNNIVENNSHRINVNSYKLYKGSHASGMDVVKKFVRDVDPTGIIEYGTREIGNPLEEQIYQAPNHRNFTFHWEFSPLSYADSLRLKEIYYFLRKSSYPITKITSRSNYRSTHGVLIMGMPHEFRLRFYNRNPAGLINPYPTEAFGTYGRCLIRDININYTGAGIPLSFVEATAFGMGAGKKGAAKQQGNAGSAPHVNMDITFSEVFQLSNASKPLNPISEVGDINDPWGYGGGD